MNSGRVQLLITIFIFLVTVFVFIKTVRSEVTYIKSSVDGKEYLVRDMEDKEEVANMLARIHKNIDRLVQHVELNKDEEESEEQRPYINQLSRRIRGVVISESTPDSKYTSYSVNKGEEIVFCVRNSEDKLHDINLVMYVCLHELAHVACPEKGHTDLFKKIFAFLTVEGMKIGIYDRIDFGKNPTSYCGMTITDSIV